MCYTTELILIIRAAMLFTNTAYTAFMQHAACFHSGKIFHGGQGRSLPLAYFQCNKHIVHCQCHLPCMLTKSHSNKC